MKRVLLAAAVVFSLAASGCGEKGTGWEGNWKVADTQGQTFYITLNVDGTATATRAGGPEAGVWSLVEDTVYISWNTGWKGMIVKEGEGFKKSAFEPGVPFSDPPTNTSSAERVDSIP
ncbi:MAG: hypothetical protein V3U18_00520 [Alphaproteobacteria bacterium]